jgi:valine dehydrogenase (NAD+)
VVVSDVSSDAVERLRSTHPQVEVADVGTLPAMPLDVYAPCALGGSLSDELVPQLQASIVCGAANNQLEHPGVETALAARGILYTPDYVANAGGLVQVADEAMNMGSGGFRFERARNRAAGIHATALAVFRLAEAEGLPPAVAADRLAERRMAEVSRLRSITLPGR